MKTSKVLFVAANVALNAAALTTFVKDVKAKKGVKTIVKNQLTYTGAAYCTLALVPELNAHINAKTITYLGHNTKAQEMTEAVASFIERAHQW